MWLCNKSQCSSQCSLLDTIVYLLNVIEIFCNADTFLQIMWNAKHFHMLVENDNKFYLNLWTSVSWSIKKKITVIPGYWYICVQHHLFRSVTSSDISTSYVVLTNSEVWLTNSCVGLTNSYVGLTYLPDSTYVCFLYDLLTHTWDLLTPT